MATTTKHSPLPWQVRVFPGNKDKFFVQAPRLKDVHPYDIEILSEDRDGDQYPSEMARADADMICLAVNNHKKLVDTVKTLVRQARLGSPSSLMVPLLDDADDLIAELKEPQPTL